MNNFSKSIMKVGAGGNSKPPLPPGWSCHVSNSCPGRVYYFNKKTGDKTWNLEDLMSRPSMKKSKFDIKKYVVVEDLYMVPVPVHPL